MPAFVGKYYFPYLVVGNGKIRSAANTIEEGIILNLTNSSDKDAVH